MKTYDYIEHGRMYGVFDGLLIEGRLDVSASDNDSDDPQEAGEQNIEGDKKTKEASDWPEKD
jgi:hypothetical protein